MTNLGHRLVAFDRAVVMALRPRDFVPRASHVIYTDVHNRDTRSVLDRTRMTHVVLASVHDELAIAEPFHPLSILAKLVRWLRS